MNARPSGQARGGNDNLNGRRDIVLHDYGSAAENNQLPRQHFAAGHNNPAIANPGQYMIVCDMGPSDSHRLLYPLSNAVLHENEDVLDNGGEENESERDAVFNRNESLQGPCSDSYNGSSEDLFGNGLGDSNVMEECETNRIGNVYSKETGVSRTSFTKRNARIPSVFNTNDTIQGGTDHVDHDSYTGRSQKEFAAKVGGEADDLVAGVEGRFQGSFTLSSPHNLSRSDDGRPHENAQNLFDERKRASVSKAAMVEAAARYVKDQLCAPNNKSKDNAIKLHNTSTCKAERKQKRTGQAAAEVAATYYGECYLEGIGSTTADEAALESHKSYKKWWLQEAQDIPIIVGSSHCLPTFNAKSGTPPMNNSTKFGADDILFYQSSSGGLKEAGVAMQVVAATSTTSTLGCLRTNDIVRFSASQAATTKSDGTNQMPSVSVYNPDNKAYDLSHSSLHDIQPLKSDQSFGVQNETPGVFDPSFEMQSSPRARNNQSGRLHSSSFQCGVASLLATRPSMSQLNITNHQQPKEHGPRLSLGSECSSFTTPVFDLEIMASMRRAGAAPPPPEDTCMLAKPVALRAYPQNPHAYCAPALECLMPFGQPLQQNQTTNNIAKTTTLTIKGTTAFSLSQHNNADDVQRRSTKRQRPQKPERLTASLDLAVHADEMREMGLTNLGSDGLSQSSCDSSRSGRLTHSSGEDTAPISNMSACNLTKKVNLALEKERFFGISNFNKLGQYTDAATLQSPFVHQNDSINHSGDVSPTLVSDSTCSSNADEDKAHEIVRDRQNVFPRNKFGPSAMFQLGPDHRRIKTSGNGKPKAKNRNRRQIRRVSDSFESDHEDSSHNRRLPQNAYTKSSMVRSNYGGTVEKGNDESVYSNSAMLRHKTNDEDYASILTSIAPPEVRMAHHIANAKTSLLHTLAVSSGDVTSQPFLFALEQLRTLYNMSGWDARDPTSCHYHHASKKIEGMWVMLSRPNYYDCLGKNTEDEYTYTLGRMSFDMFRPTNLVCSVQGVFNNIGLANTEDRIGVDVPRGLRQELADGNSVLRTYDIVTAMTVEPNSPCFGSGSPNKDVFRPIRGIMTTNGYVLPDPNIPNRLSVWFTGGNMQVNDDAIDVQEWKRVFGGSLPRRNLKEKARLLAAKLLLGAVVSDEMSADGRMSFQLKRPIGGHGTAYVDVLYMDDTFRVVQGHKGSIFVCARVPQVLKG